MTGRICEQSLNEPDQDVLAIKYPPAILQATSRLDFFTSVMFALKNFSLQVKGLNMDSLLLQMAARDLKQQYTYLHN